MAHRKAAPPTPAQVAVYGHIATAMRAYLAEHKLRPSDMNERLGLHRTNTMIYGWINARAAPGPKHRTKLAKLLGIQPQDLLPREGAEILSPAAARAIVKPTPTARSPDVLQFSVAADGEARIRLDIQLPVEQATPLLRMLLDAGLVLGTKE